MTSRFAALTLAIFMRVTLQSQTDSIVYNADLKMSDGVYLTYEDFRRNLSVTKDFIVSKYDKNQLEFLTKVMYEDSFSFRKNDSVIVWPTGKAWGFIQNNTFYVNFREDFYRIPVFGSISYLVANVTIQNIGFYDPRFGYSTGATNTKELREFLINFYDGQLAEFSLDNFEQLLVRDPALYSEFKKLGRRKQKDQLYKFLRRYNENHPVYFLRKLS